MFTSPDAGLNLAQNPDILCGFEGFIGIPCRVSGLTKVLGVRCKRESSVWGHMLLGKGFLWQFHVNSSKATSYHLSLYHSLN